MNHSMRFSISHGLSSRWEKIVKKCGKKKRKANHSDIQRKAQTLSISIQPPAPYIFHSAYQISPNVNRKQSELVFMITMWVITIHFDLLRYDRISFGITTRANNNLISFISQTGTNCTTVSFNQQLYSDQNRRINTMYYVFPWWQNLVPSRAIII